MSTQAQVEQVKKPLFGWKTRMWLLVICYLVGLVVVESLLRVENIYFSSIYPFLRMVYILLPLGFAYYFIKKGTNPFWTLVRNDMMSMFQWKKYVWVLLIVLLTTLTVSVRLLFSLSIYWKYSYYSAAIFWFLPFVLAYYCTKMEWKNKTVSWWLTLPHSKEQLISSKIIAIVIRCLQIYLPALVLAGITVSVIQYQQTNNLTGLLVNSLSDVVYGLPNTTLDFAREGLASLILGIVIALISESVFKKYLLFPVLFALLFVNYHRLIGNLLDYLMGWNSSYPYPIIILGSTKIPLYFTLVIVTHTIILWPIAYLFYRFAVYLSENKIEA